MLGLPTVKQITLPISIVSVRGGTRETADHVAAEGEAPRLSLLQEEGAMMTMTILTRSAVRQALPEQNVITTNNFSFIAKTDKI
jgi:hypothetical protein